MIDKYLQEKGFDILNKRFKDNGDTLELDQMFSNKSTIFFVEQKVRDDHDSSKKRGQIDNFEKKISAILEEYKGKEVVEFFYFIDDSFTKNKRPLHKSQSLIFISTFTIFQKRFSKIIHIFHKNLEIACLSSLFLLCFFIFNLLPLIRHNNPVDDSSA